MVGTIYGAQQKAGVLMKNWSSAEIVEFVRGALDLLGGDAQDVVKDWVPTELIKNVVEAIGKLQDLVDCIRDDASYQVSIHALEKINDLLDP